MYKAQWAGVEAQAQLKNWPPAFSAHDQQPNQNSQHNMYPKVIEVQVDAVIVSVRQKTRATDILFGQQK